MGTHQGLKQVRKVVIDCMNNIHPVYNIKILMIKRELAKDPNLANENWDRFLPNFKKKNVKRKKPAKVRQKKASTPFPPPQQPSKVDLQLESGEYFLTEKQRKVKKQADKMAKASEVSRAKREKRQQDYVAPLEENDKPMKKQRKSGDTNDVTTQQISKDTGKSVDELKQSFLKKKNKGKKEKKQK